SAGSRPALSPYLLFRLPTLCYHLVLHLVGLCIAAGLLASGELWRRVRNFLVGNAAEDVGNAVEAGTLLIIRRHHVPRGGGCVRGTQHGVASPRVVVPAAMRLQIHWTQFPALRRVFDTCEEAAMLLLFRDIEPVLQQDDAIADNEVFEDGTAFEKLLVFLLGAEPHHMLDPGAVVPAPVADDDFSARGQMLNVALRVDL